MSSYPRSSGIWQPDNPLNNAAETGLTQADATSNASSNGGGSPPPAPQYRTIRKDVLSTSLGLADVEYIAAGATTQPGNANVPAPALEFDLVQIAQQGLVPGSLIFDFGGDRYVERNGDLYRAIDPETNAGTLAGSVDYANKKITITDWPEGAAGALDFKAMLITTLQTCEPSLYFRTDGSPLRVGSLQVVATAVDGTQYIATSNNDGFLEDPSGVVRGGVDYQNGWVGVHFVLDDNGGSLDGTTWTMQEIVAATVKYNGVVIGYLPISEEIIGLDTTRLPLDGTVPVIIRGDIVIIHHEDVDAMPSPLGQSQVVALSRAQLAAVRFEDQDGVRVPDNFFTVDLEAGEVTTANDLDLTGYVEPLKAYHRIEDMRVCTEAQLGGKVAINRGLSRDFPADSKISSAVYFGNLQARIADLFTQKVWGNEWLDERDGNDSVAKYDDITYPIAVSNRGAVTDRWAIVFTGNTTFNVVSELRGIVETGDIGSDLSVINPLTNEPYFQILAAGWGTGWITNNVLRFNTVSATHPLWLARCVLPGSTALQDDSGRIEIRGDAD